mmetsp:Transcript_3681/g.6495  ORF Transcript_3681/g.6495 Transcript_3681/m.6495 type:complete len:261 (+) Transcript_3681:723-1505(+)
MEVLNGKPEEALPTLLWVLIHQLRGHRQVGQAAIMHARGARAEDLHVAMAVIRGSTVHHMVSIRSQCDSLLGAILRINTANPQAIPLQSVQVDEEAISSHIVSVEAPSNTSSQVCQGFFNIAAPANSVPSTTVCCRIGWVSQCADFGICFLHNRRPKHVGKVLRTAAKGLAISGRWDIIVHLHSHPDPILEKTNNVNASLHVVCIEELTSQSWSKRDGIKCFYKVRVIQLAAEDAAKIRGIRLAFVKENTRALLRLTKLR